MRKDLETIPHDGMAFFIWNYVGRKLAKKLAEARGISVQKARQKLHAEYRAVLTRTPDIKGSPLRFTLVWGCLMVALLDTFSDITEQEFKECVELVLDNKLIPFYKRHTDLYEKQANKAADYTGVNEFDWNRTVDLAKQPEEFSVHFTQCGLTTLFKKEHKLAWLKYACALDYLMMADSTIDLVRTKTLARGDECCNFRIINNKLSSAQEVMQRDGISPEDLV